MEHGAYTLNRARRRALEVFARAARGEATESNLTSPPAAVDAETATPKIYWQLKVWLEAEGLIEAVPGRPRWYRLTAAGAALVEQLGFGLPPPDAGPAGRDCAGREGGGPGGSDRSSHLCRGRDL